MSIATRRSSESRPRRIPFLSLVATLGLTALMAACETKCDYVLDAEIPSPDLLLTASTHESNCHSTSPLLTVVQLRKSSAKLDPRSEENDVFVVKGKPGLSVEWANKTALLVRCRQCTQNSPFQILRKKDRWGHVVIRYDIPDNR